MTIEELLARESIRQTIANYTIAGDRLREDDFVAVFTADGVLESEGVADADLFRYEGREQIRQWISRWRNRPEGASTAHQATFVRHHLATTQINLTGPDTAKGRIYWTAYTDIGPDHCGYYLDTYAKENDRWLIAHRRIRLDWQSENTLFTTAISNTR